MLEPEQPQHRVGGVLQGSEGGEFETFVLDGPNFKKRIVIDEAKKDWHRDSGSYRITGYHLEDKTRPGRSGF